MKRTLKRCFIGLMLAVLLGASCLLAACGDNETPPGTETAFTIEGVVSSDLGPLSGVAVTLGEESKTTGTAGSYSFEVAEGEYTLTFAKDGYVTQTKTVNTDDAVSGKVTLNVNMAAVQAEYVVISGTVTDADGVALEGAVISGSALDSSVTTGADGAYTLPQLEKGSYSFTVSMNGYTSQTVSVSESDITDDTYTLNIQLTAIPAEELVTVSGTVTADYPEGALAGVTVKIGTTEVKTDANGAYSVQTSRDACTVEFSKAGYAAVSESVSAEDVADGAHTLNAEMTRNTVLAGKTNAELVEEYSSMNNIAVSGQLKDLIHAGTYWKEGGADGSAAGILSEGYRLESKQDNANDEFRRYIYGKMTVSAENEIFDFWGRTFGDATEFAVSVIDPVTLDRTLVKATCAEVVWASLLSNTLVRFTYDLSAFEGRDVILALGVRKAALTVERVSFGPGTYVFGRTTKAEFDGAKTLDLTTKTSYEGGEIRTAWNVLGNIEGMNTDSDYATKNARFYACYVGQNTAADADLFMYVYAKVNITGANARMSIRWYNDRAPFLRVTAFDATTGAVVQTVNAEKGSGETETSTVDLADCIGKTVVLAIGMTSGERLELQKISFARYSYTLKGKVSLPEGDYSLDKVSFTLDDSPLTSGENGFTFDTQTGTYSLTLDASVTTGTLKVSYDNTGIANPTQQLVEAAFSLSDIKDYGNAAWSPTLSQNSDAAQTIYVRISIDSPEAQLTDDQAEEVTVKLGNDRTFSYAGEGVWKLEGLTVAEAMAAGDLTVTFAEEGTLANIYKAVNEGTLSGSDYADGQARITISLTERDIMPGLTLSEMKSATVLSYDYYQGLWAHNVFRNFQKSEGIRSQEQKEGDTIQTATERATSETEFNGYIYARKTITEQNKFMLVNMRVHGDTGETQLPTRFGVMIVDLATGRRELIGGMRSSTDQAYNMQVFNLTQYVGKEVLVTTGIFYTQACDDALPDGKQLQYVIESIRFIPAVDAWKTDSAANWKATVDTIAGNLLANESVAANSLTYFQGANNDKDNENYIFKTWGAVSKGQDYAGIEPANEGAMIKTRNGSTDTSDNRAFLYAKFTITEETSYLWLNARSFNSLNTSSALTVYSEGESGVVTGAVAAPDIDNFAYPAEGGAAEVQEGNWVNWNDADKGYVYLKWDLEAYVGQTVVLVIGVRNLEHSGEHESKMAIQEIHLGSAAEGQSAGKVTA